VALQRVDAQNGPGLIDALDAPSDGTRRWFLHGGVAQGNLLLDGDGQLGAVIDFGTCGVGAPACDLAVAWTLLTDDGHRHSETRYLFVHLRGPR
jgi:aminoglycoside phosphotransferase (APT) family kinase protein